MWRAFLFPAVLSTSLAFWSLAAAPANAQPSCECAAADECLSKARSLRATQLEEARRCYDRSCTLGDAGACRELADTVPWDQRDVDEQQLSLARDAATRGCQKGNEQACGILVGLFAQSGDPDVIRPAERACAAGSAQMCFELGTVWLARPKTPAAWTKGRRFLERACAKANPDACASLAEVYAFGDAERGLAPSRQKANQLWWRACHLGRAYACEHGARLERAGAPADERAPFERAAVRFLQRGCALKSQWSCAHLRDRQCTAGDEAACKALHDIKLGSCARRCRTWRGQPNEEDRSCAEWGSTCDDERAQAERPLRSALREATAACLEGEQRRVRVQVAVIVFVTGRVEVGSVQLGAPVVDGKRPAECLRERLSALRTSGLREKVTMRLVEVHRPR